MIKSILSIVLFTLISIQGLAQTIHVVDRNITGIIGDFNNFTDAYNAASNGDIILLIPSTGTYGDIILSNTNGKQVTIAGSGMNGPNGTYTKVGTITLDGGSSGNTNLDGIVFGGFNCESIDVNFVDDIKIKGVSTRENIASTNFELRIRNSSNVEIEFLEVRNAHFDANVDMKIIQSDFYDDATAPALQIVNSSNFIVTNSLIESNTTNTVVNTITVDGTSTGKFKNNVIIDYTSSNFRPMDFGGTDSLINNIIMDVSGGYLRIIGGKAFRSNVIYSQVYSRFQNQTTDADLTVDGVGNPDLGNNAFYNPLITIATAEPENYLRLQDASPAINQGLGTDPDGSQADIGVYGGPYRVDELRPTFAKGISVIPTTSDLKVGLPHNGTVRVKVKAKAKKN